MIRMLPVVRSFPAPGRHLCGMTWDGRDLWHSDASTDRLYCIDRNTGSILREIACEAVRTDLAYDGAFLWQIAGHPKCIRVFDPDTGDVRQEIALPGNPENVCGLFVEGDDYWIGRKSLALIEQRARKDNALLREYRALTHIDGLARVGSTLWFTCFDQRLLVGIDMESGGERHRFAVQGNPTGMCWDGQWFWYSDYANRRLVAVSLTGS